MARRKSPRSGKPGKKPAARKTASRKAPVRRKEPAGKTSTRSVKNDRLEIRLTVDQKELIERASALRGASLSSFVTETVVGAARETLNEEHSMRLNAEQSAKLVQLLNEPPKPNEALRDLADDFRAGKRKPGF